MNATIKDKAVRKTNEAIFFPCVAVILPLDSGVTSPNHLKEMTNNIEAQLLEKYKTERVKPVMEKLNHALSNINYSGNKKSVAIFVSPIYEKEIHLEVTLEETVLVDESFEIRDLVHNINPVDKYLVLVQSGTSFRIFLGDPDNLLRIKVSIPDNIAAYKNDIAEKIEYFTDTTDRKEILMDKFIHHIDKELEHFLNKYNLPVFVLGTEKMNGHFKKYTHNEKSILAYIHGNYDEAKPHQLIEHIKPYLKEITKKEYKSLAEKIEKALGVNRLSIGIDEVWRSAKEKKGQLLIVENNYSFPHTADGEGNINRDVSEIHPSLIKDAADIIIEQVLESGGEVRFVDADLMKDLGHIALFLYF